MQHKTETSTSDVKVYVTPSAVPRIEIFNTGNNRSKASSKTNNNNNNDEPNNAASLTTFSTTSTTSSAQVHVVSCDLTARLTSLNTAAGLERGEEPGMPLTLKQKANPILASRRAILVSTEDEQQEQQVTLVTIFTHCFL